LDTANAGFDADFKSVEKVGKNFTKKVKSLIKNKWKTEKLNFLLLF
jgi:hypothetical protein